MKAALARLGDVMLSHVLPAAEAGALCCSGAGTDCKCGGKCGVNWCTQYKIDCACRCVATTSHC